MYYSSGGTLSLTSWRGHVRAVTPTNGDTMVNLLELLPEKEEGINLFAECAKEE